MAEHHGWGERKNISSSTMQIMPCTTMPTLPGVYLSESRPLTRLPTTMPKPASIINAVTLPALNPDTFVSNGVM